MENKIQAHIKAAASARKLLPMTKTIIEAASFDMQKIRSPDISVTDCQNGDQPRFGTCGNAFYSATGINALDGRIARIPF
ncbi:MAG: RRXRR domain-containing protein [Clostridiales bacterium]|nr:RRXRR domain-containing protein [Clostridiales bacterium]